MEVSLEDAFKVACQELGEAIVREKCLENEINRRIELEQEAAEKEANKEAPTEEVVANDKSNEPGKSEANGRVPQPTS